MEKVSVFKDLPIEVRRRILESKLLEPRTLRSINNKKVSAIGGFFNWGDTPEGHEYWYSISRGEYDESLNNREEWDEIEL